MIETFPQFRPTSSLHAAPSPRRAPKHFDEMVAENAAPPAAGRALCDVLSC